MKYILSPKTPHVFNNLMADLAALNPEKTWTISIEEKTLTRSTRQNSIYWKWITIMGDHFGYSKDEMHEELAARFLGMVERKTIGGRKIIEPRSTKTLSTKEFGEYLTTIQALAMQQNIRLPAPDYYGLTCD